MARTKFKEIRLSDSINRSIKVGFTQIPNDFIRNPNITAKAKAILGILLSNKDGWKTYTSVLPKMMKEKKDAIDAGLRELKVNGYLLRIKFRDKITKIIKGSFWAITDDPFNYSLSENIKKLDKIGCEIIGNHDYITDNRKNHQMEKPGIGKSALKNTNNKNTNLNPGEEENFNLFWKIYPESPNKISQGQTKRIWKELFSKENKLTWKILESALLSQIKTERWKDPKFIPNPATWLREERWMDDPKKMVTFERTINDNRPKYKDNAGVRYYLASDGEYYHKSGERWID